MPDNNPIVTSTESPDPIGVIADPNALFAKVLEWQAQGFHVLSPALRVMAFAPGYAVNVSMVLLDSRVDENGFGADTYYDKTTMKAPAGVSAPSAERAISAMGLKRIAQCAGVAWHPELTGRLGDRALQNLWEYRAVGLVQGIDGTWMSLHGTKEVDFRDGSAQIGGWTPEKWAALLETNKTAADKLWNINGWSERRVLQARAQGLRLAETKAMSAAIRQLGLKHRYTVDELTKPFVVLRVSYMPDLADPAVRQLVMQRALAGTSALYGQRPMMEPAPERRALNAASTVIDFPAETIERQPASVSSVPDRQAGSAPDPAAATPAPTAQPQPPAASVAPAAPPAGAPPSDPKSPGALVHGSIVPWRYVAQSRILKSGKKKDDTPWTLYSIEFDDGTKITTLESKFADIAAQAVQQHLPVTISTHPDPQFGLQLDAIAIVDTRQASLPMGDAAPTQPAAPAATQQKPGLTAADLKF